MVNSTGGYLDNAIKYHIQSIKPRRVETSTFDSVCSAVENVNLDNEYNDEQAQEDLRFLKGVVVNDHNMNEITLKLAKTAEYRTKLLEKKEIDLRNEFPYFFTHPRLVRMFYQLLNFLHSLQYSLNIHNCHFFIFLIMQIDLDFGNHFPKVDTLAIKSYWETGSKKLKLIFERFYPTTAFSTQWPLEVDVFLIFIRLFPAKKPSEVFTKAIEKLITFRTVCPIVFTNGIMNNHFKDAFSLHPGQCCG